MPREELFRFAFFDEHGECLYVLNIGGKRKQGGWLSPPNLDRVSFCQLWLETWSENEEPKRLSINLLEELLKYLAHSRDEKEAKVFLREIASQAMKG